MQTKYVIGIIVTLIIGLWFGLRPAHANLEDVRIVFFYGDVYEKNEKFLLKDAGDILRHPKYDASRPTVLYVFGYIENMDVESVHLIVDSYLERGDHNVLILDWTTLAEGNFLMTAVPNAKQLGQHLGVLLINMVQEGLVLDKLHLVGHSLGGQLCGYVGRTVKKSSEGKLTVKRISALDPAFPPFYPGFGVTALSQKDAEFVDVIHTDAWLYGAPVSTGTVDFWPNGGKSLQPGCPKRNYKPLSDNDLCSHRRSWRFWAESVSRKSVRTFPAVKAKSWSDFKAGRYDKATPVAYMGIDCEPNVTGDYYLATNGQIPFSIDHLDEAMQSIES